MELQELYEVQAGLKARINYEGSDKFPKMMLAMMVEFMECANDWRGFKYWSKDQGSKQTLLEEYVDGLHFILEAGLDLLEKEAIMMLPKRADVYVVERDITKQFKIILFKALKLEAEEEAEDEYVDIQYIDLFEQYLTLGVSLGFTEQQIVDAYMDKNRVNHERQNTGY